MEATTILTRGDPAQASAHQTAQELRPERFGLAGADLHAQDLALALRVDSHRHYHGHAHYGARLPVLDVGGIDPQVGPVALDGAVQERAHALIKLGAQA